jgi:hypothetical protein
MLKLFRDHVFHSVTAEGRPWLDQAHLAYCLNQLDGGTQDKVRPPARAAQHKTRINSLIFSSVSLKDVTFLINFF